jgi:hypothetical protein
MPETRRTPAWVAVAAIAFDRLVDSIFKRIV